MQLTFNSIEEVKEFVKGLKGTRGGKGGDDGDQETAKGAQVAPAPLPPPAAGFTGGAAGFAGAFPAGIQATSSPFGGNAASGPSHEVLALATRIATKIDGALASGQNPDAALQWLRTESVRLGFAEAASATMDQIKSIFLPKMTQPALENICKLTGA